jgi:hypothetical protein
MTTSAIRSTSCALLTVYGMLSMWMVLVERVSGPSGLVDLLELFR